MSDLVERLKRGVRRQDRKPAENNQAERELAKEAANRIEALEAERDENWQKYVDANEARIDAEAERDALQAKLDKAVGALVSEMLTHIAAYKAAEQKGAYPPLNEGFITTTLAKLEGINQ